MRLEAIAVTGAKGWEPPEPASSKRAWMDAIPHGFAYRCIPLAIANAAGWVIRCPTTITGRWGGRKARDNIDLWFTEGDARRWGVSNIFGHGLLTFTIPWLFRLVPAEPYSLWVRGYPNYHKQAVQPVEGIVEVGWSPFTFTMSWQTRAKTPFQFKKGEPLCFFTLTDLHQLQTLETRLVPKSEVDPAIIKTHAEYLASRTAFNARRDRGSKEWQRYYLRGTDAAGCPVAPASRVVTLRLQPFIKDPPPHEAAPESPVLADLQRQASVPLHGRDGRPEEAVDPDRPGPQRQESARHGDPRGDPRRVPVSQRGRGRSPGRPSL